ncbi:uncharacterized protein DFL_003016 [Arthrobotrys flagrans]|uniref:DUF7896 domain-containing protein n=1 Tax=Arthrobotrys flagrans TaxID=97331 RepID=A0A437AC65_ARTFL|nr:hypothetical protein DFL_003016 [Arthrobotrys flagrans]
METATSARSHYDPVRQQFLRYLHWYLGQITNEMIDEAGENYDRKKRNDKFYNSIKFLADYVVRFNDGQEKGRETTVVARSSTTGIHTGLQTFTTNSSLHTQQQQQQQQQQPISVERRPQISVAPQQSELASLSHASLPRGRSFSEAQVPGTMHNPLAGNTNRSSVSPTSALETTFPSMPSLQGSRVQSSESVPTVGSISPSQSPSNTNTTRNNVNPSTNHTDISSTLQNKPTTNFGFLVPPRKTPTSVTPLQQAAISATAEIEASLADVSDFLAPQRDTAVPGQQTAVMATKQPSASRPTPITGLNTTDVSDNNASQGGGRKRKRQKKQWCMLCNEHKEGFRGPHELARHINIQHQTKKTVFIVYDDSPGGGMFKNCKHCSRRKIYGQDYNAACHLRRAHFNKRLKTDTPEEREFKQLHPDFPPMEELRPWLRKCLVDVSKLKDGKYIDSQDEAILKVEPAVKLEDLTSSDQDKDQEMTDDEPLQPVGPATPPPDSEVEAEAPRPPLNDNPFDFDFSEFQQPDFIFNSPPLPQSSTIPRTSNFNAIFALQMQSMGISPEQILSDKVPDFLGFENNIFAPFSMPELPSNNAEAFGINGSLEDFDINQFLQGP